MGWVFETQFILKKGLVGSLIPRFVHILVLYLLFLAKICAFPFWKRRFVSFPVFFQSCWDHQSLKDILVHVSQPRQERLARSVLALINFVFVCILMLGLCRKHTTVAVAIIVVVVVVVFVVMGVVKINQLLLSPF